MSKVAQSFYSVAAAHKELDGLYQASFGFPGELPKWVTEEAGKPKVFRSAQEAELAGCRVLVTKLNKVRDVQSFMTKRDRKSRIRTYRAPERHGEPTIEQVFGKKNRSNDGE